jgi:hypothetical protein
MQVPTLNVARVPMFCRPVAAKRGPCCQRAVANFAAVATAENAGDVKWNKTYYPTLADTSKAEKDWCVPACIRCCVRTLSTTLKCAAAT